MKVGDLVKVKETGFMDEIVKISEDVEPVYHLEEGGEFIAEELEMFMAAREQAVRVPRLVQLSTPTCPPCQMYRRLINANFEESFLDTFYDYLDVTIDKKRYYSLAARHAVRGVPRFLVLDQHDELVKDFNNDGKTALRFLDEVRSLTATSRTEEE